MSSNELSMLSITWYVPYVALQEKLLGRHATDINYLISDQIKTIGCKPWKAEIKTVIWWKSIIIKICQCSMLF